MVLKVFVNDNDATESAYGEEHMAVASKKLEHESLFFNFKNDKYECIFEFGKLSMVIITFKDGSTMETNPEFINHETLFNGLGFAPELA